MKLKLSPMMTKCLFAHVEYFYKQLGVFKANGLSKDIWLFMFINLPSHPVPEYSVLQEYYCTNYCM